MEIKQLKLFTTVRVGEGELQINFERPNVQLFSFI